MEHAFVSLLLVVVTAIVSYRGFKNEHFKAAYCFDVEKVLVHKQYIRLISSGFLHSSWMHLIFNMIALLAFGGLLEPVAGPLQFLFIYAVSLVGGNLLSLFLNKSNSLFTSLGASGAVNGIVFATIALFPTMGIGLFFLPLSIPAWAFGLAYVLFTIYGIKARWGATDHAGHLGGALIGLLSAIAFYPEAAVANYLPILAVALPTVAFILLTVFRPHTLVISGSGKRRFHSIDHEYNARRVEQEADVDSILEKIHRKGLKSLTRKERELLETYSRIKQ